MTITFGVGAAVFIWLALRIFHTTLESIEQHAKSAADALIAIQRDVEQLHATLSGIDSDLSEIRRAVAPRDRV